MADNHDLMKKFAALGKSQQRVILDLVRAMGKPVRIDVNPASDVVTPGVAGALADAFIAHHVATGNEAFAKRKFEHALVKALGIDGHEARVEPGLGARDISVDGQGWSLKTQADSGISMDEIHISKFMELGKGRWESEDDLRGLRDAMLDHMRHYERIFTLRCFINSPKYRSVGRVVYELVEIPKALLAHASHGEFRMVTESTQNPKPGYCTVKDESGVLFQLYFDAGSERKLQVKHLQKSACVVHATWDLEISD